MNRKASICCLFSGSASCFQLDAARNRAEQQGDSRTADPRMCATPSALLCAPKASRGFSIPSPVWVGACFGDGGGPFCPSESIPSSSPPPLRLLIFHQPAFVCLFVCLSAHPVSLLPVPPSPPLVSEHPPPLLLRVGARRQAQPHLLLAPLHLLKKKIKIKQHRGGRHL